MSSDNDEVPAAAVSQAFKGLRETNQKVEASLLTAIENHVKNHSSKAGVDFLDVKNSLLLSYLIDLTLYLKAKITGKPLVEGSLQRLQEMKVVLDKLRSLDKKLRYQIDKLLQAATVGSYVTDATVRSSEHDNPQQSDDPLQYRPDPKAFGGSDDDDASSSDESDSDENEENGENSIHSDDEDGDDDDDLEAAKRTLAMAKLKSSKSKKDDGDNDKNDGVYRAPRHTAMPYLLDKEDKEAARQKRERRRLRTSELAQSLRQQYGDAPEQEDVFGGTEFGKQAAAAKKFAKFQEEKTQFEENAMIRLTVTRKEKKERKRIMRMEGSNLNGIADLGNLAAEASRVIGNDGDNEHQRDTVGGPSARTERYANGKRKKEILDHDGRPMKMGKKAGKVKNAYQAALYGGESGSGKKKKKSKR